MARRIVDFEKYCEKCAHRDANEHDPKVPCYDCLAQPWNDDSRKPIRYKPAEDKK